MPAPISIRLPDPLARRLEKVAKETERSRSYLVQKALESWIDEYEDAMVAMDRLADNEDEVIAPSAMRKRIGV